MVLDVEAVFCVRLLFSSDIRVGNTICLDSSVEYLSSSTTNSSLGHSPHGFVTRYVSYLIKVKNSVSRLP